MNGNGTNQFAADVNPETETPRRLEIPPVRTFVVTRYKPDSKLREIEKVTIEAHIVHHSEGNVLFFTEFILVGNEAFAQVRRLFNPAHWIDVEEVCFRRSSALLYH